MGGPLGLRRRLRTVGCYSALLNGRSYDVGAEAGAEVCYAAVNGRRYAIEVRDPRRLSRSRGAIAVAVRQKPFPRCRAK